MGSHLTIRNNLLTEATFRNIFNKGTLQDKCMVYKLEGCIYLAERTNTCLLFSKHLTPAHVVILQKKTVRRQVLCSKIKCIAGKLTKTF